MGCLFDRPLVMALHTEHHITFASSLAATLGLNEAVLLQVLNDIRQHNPAPSNDWMSITAQQLQSLLPFWSFQQIEQIADNLMAQGVISKLPTDGQLMVKLDAPAPQQVKKPPTPAAAAPTKEEKPADLNEWRPSEAALQQLKAHHGIGTEFVQQHLAEFIYYWRSRNTDTRSWDNKFIRHMAAAWHKEQARANARKSNNLDKGFQVEAPKPQRLTREWQPPEDAVDILVKGGVEQEFIDDAVPEFILYWRERGDAVQSWGAKFVAHIRRQWGIYHQHMQHDPSPKRISENWQPSADVFDILAMANIDTQFAHQLIPEFVLFWRESNQLHTSWNSKYLQHVKHHWAKQLGQSADGRQPQSATGTDRRGFIEKHTDRSWADGL